VIWFAVVLYLVLSPLACLLIGRAIRRRETERPVELCEPVTESGVEPTAEAPVAADAVVVEPQVAVAS
jgi:hypothetical protein